MKEIGILNDDRPDRMRLSAPAEDDQLR